MTRESEPRREQQPERYYLRIAKYEDVQLALEAYQKTQELVFESDCNLSAYRIRHEDVPYVVVLGDKPTQEIEDKITAELKDGEQAELPTGVVDFLTRRKAQMGRMGPIFEGHYRPGIDF